MVAVITLIKLLTRNNRACCIIDSQPQELPIQTRSHGIYVTETKYFVVVLGIRSRLTHRPFHAGMKRRQSTNTHPHVNNNYYFHELGEYAISWVEFYLAFEDCMT